MRIKKWREREREREREIERERGRERERQRERQMSFNESDFINSTFEMLFKVFDFIF